VSSARRIATRHRSGNMHGNATTLLRSELELYNKTFGVTVTEQA
jgi:hypothetical protein